MKKQPWIVGVYDVDRAFGGPEEGGWWYDVGYPVPNQKELGGGATFFNKEKAYAYSRMLNDALDRANKARGPYGDIGSVLCDGALRATVVRRLEPFPRCRPHYE